MQSSSLTVFPIVRRPPTSASLDCFFDGVGRCFVKFVEDVVIQFTIELFDDGDDGILDVLKKNKLAMAQMQCRVVE
jgi:hypothetical protein